MKNVSELLQDIEMPKDLHSWLDYLNSKYHPHYLRIAPMFYKNVELPQDISELYMALKIIFGAEDTPKFHNFVSRPMGVLWEKSCRAQYKGAKYSTYMDKELKLDFTWLYTGYNIKLKYKTAERYLEDNKDDMLEVIRTEGLSGIFFLCIDGAIFLSCEGKVEKRIYPWREYTFEQDNPQYKNVRRRY